MASGAIRAFFAIDLGEAARRGASAVARRLRAGRGGDAVRWVRPEVLHVTLRFLGDIAPGAAAPLAGYVASELAPLAPFELRLGEARLFPTPRRPRVVALALAPEEALQALFAGVERGVRAAGFEPEPRRFRPHLTLGRLRPGRRTPPDVAGLAAPPDACCEVSEVVLFRSELGTEDGTRYTPLERCRLGGV